MTLAVWDEGSPTRRRCAGSLGQRRSASWSRFCASQVGGDECRGQRYKPQRFCVCTGEFRSESHLFEAALDVPLLPHVVQTGKPDIEPLGAECLHELADVRRAPDRQDDDALGLKVPTASLRQRLEGCLVTPPFDKDRRAGADPNDHLARSCRTQWGAGNGNRCRV